MGDSHTHTHTHHLLGCVEPQRVFVKATTFKNAQATFAFVSAERTPSLSVSLPSVRVECSLSGWTATSILRLGVSSRVFVLHCASAVTYAMLLPRPTSSSVTTSPIYLKHHLSVEITSKKALDPLSTSTFPPIIKHSLRLLTPGDFRPKNKLQAPHKITSDGDLNADRQVWKKQCNWHNFYEFWVDAGIIVLHFSKGVWLWPYYFSCLGISSAPT